jgi:16S rRNA pseudouridine516 synthase
MERIDKLLAHEGYGSRKEIRKILHKCEVLINGTRVTDPGTQFDVDKDTLTIDEEQIDFHKHLYLMMNKPQDAVCSTKEGAKQTVFDLLDDSLRTPYFIEKLHIIGRLDIDTEGLLLFTTDGELTHRLISPKTHVSKTYYCELEHEESEEDQAQITRQFEEGIEIEAEHNEAGFTAQPAFIKWQSPDKALLTIYEGKYHQVKRMFVAVGNKIVYLKRISMGQLQLDPELELGEYKELYDDDLEKLNR